MTTMTKKKKKSMGRKFPVAGQLDIDRGYHLAQQSRLCRIWSCEKVRNF
jgi:hypothetical protein